jgi:formylmethanofuran dehydrogenase subunit E
MTENQEEFEKLIQKAAELRGHRCMGLPLGIKMAQIGLKLLKMTDEESKENLVVFVENDKCHVDAIQVATGCSAGSRRLKMMPYGKSAATFVNKSTGVAYRVAEKKDLTKRALDLAIKDKLVGTDTKIEEFSKVEKTVLMNAFMKLPPEELFDVYPVRIVWDDPLVSPKRMPRKNCTKCGEEVRDGFAVEEKGKMFCRACAREAYYQRL